MQDLGLTYRSEMAMGSPRHPRATRELLIGRSFGAGRYVLKELIGRGGMGQVYRAWQRSLERDVALKVLVDTSGQAANGRRQEEFMARFVREARASAALSHPHAVTVFDVGKERATGYLAMELLRGQTLQQALQGGPLAVASAISIASQIGDAIDAAHALGTLHRDVKPGNIMLLAADAVPGYHEGPYAKLLDFGLAKLFAASKQGLTRVGQRLGSPGYMAPEQARGGSLDGRCDVYALGAVLCEMLLGRPAFRAKHLQELLAAQAAGPPPSPLALGWQPEAQVGGEVARAIDRVVQRAMAFAPAERYPTMATLLADLRGLLPLPSSTLALDARAPEATQLLAPPEGSEPAWRPAGQRPVRLHLVAPSDGERAAAAQSPPSLSQLESPRWTSAQSPAFGPVTARSLHPVWAALLSGAVGVLGVAAGVSLAKAPKWHITSAPAGAKVYDGQEVLCRQTPCTVRWQSSDLGRQVHLRFVLPGHDEAIFSRKVERRNKALSVLLEAGEAACSLPPPEAAEAED